MSAAYTKGPWKLRGRFVDAEHDWATKYVMGDRQCTVAHISMNTKADKDEAMANALLISVAPTLHAVTKALLEVVKAQTAAAGTKDERRAIKRAIAVLQVIERGPQ